jgi:hypothetical protein
LSQGVRRAGVEAADGFAEKERFFADLLGFYVTVNAGELRPPLAEPPHGALHAPIDRNASSHAPYAISQSRSSLWLILRQLPA